MDNGIREKFTIRRGFFNQKYLSVRLKNCEVTIDNLLPTEGYQLSICTPYNEREAKRGAGAGEVKRWWFFDRKEDVFDFIKNNPILMSMLQ